MKYSLEITQKSGDEKNLVQVPAEGAYEGKKLILTYNFDGAPYTLEISEKSISQTRGGAFRLTMCFKENETTTARLTDGVNGGEFPVQTQNLEIVFDGANVKALCRFSLGGGEEATELEITATLLQ
ncbi:MAG: DUF1934 family protein [Clostridia bacterium]|nr:DUF1934 family protein [Clostridia bacterium]